MIKNNIFFGFKKIFILFFLLLFFSIICAFGYINTVSAHIADSVFRLHVIANSDSEADQNLKYLVRDELIEYMNTLIDECTSKETAMALVNEHLNEFKTIAEAIVLENGFDYPVGVEVGNFEFPTKEYGDVSLPAGFYDALKVKLGNAEGKNWWCVMFPPLCFVDITSGVVPDESKELMHKELSDEEFYLVSKDTPEIKFKFKLLELFSSVANTLTAKK